MANIGLAWVNPAPLTKPENVVNFAKKCEAMGCHSMWTIDRIAYDNLEPLTILAAAAGATQKIRLGTSVLLGNLRHPSHLAKIIATLDFIANSRVILGLGFGSRENDYKAVEIPFEHRGSRAVEQVQLMKRFWTEDGTEVALKRAGTWADGFICGSSAIPDFPATWEKISGYAKAAGRDPN